MTHYQRIKAVLSGGLSFSELTPSEQSAIRLPIYHKAVDILALPKPERAAAIDREPESIREHIKVEIIRVHGLRNNA